MSAKATLRWRLDISDLYVFYTEALPSSSPSSIHVGVVDITWAMAHGHPARARMGGSAASSMNFVGSGGSSLVCLLPTVCFLLPPADCSSWLHCCNYHAAVPRLQTHPLCSLAVQEREERRGLELAQERVSAVDEAKVWIQILETCPS